MPTPTDRSRRDEGTQVVEVPRLEAPGASRSISTDSLRLYATDLASPRWQRVRQTWNKYNLYNLSALRTPYLMPKTFFQQKWVAKSLTRGYHGEHIKENKWERMFSRRLLSVVNMNPWYMAKHNGSEQAAGRGSGLVGVKRPIMNPGNMRAPTPYMQMTFAPMERRLDIAIFRAMFASSARQARQFVVHGFVTVNGKKVRGGFTPVVPNSPMAPNRGVADKPRTLR